MILLDTDTFTLHHVGHRKVAERVVQAAEIPKLTVVTQIEALRGRQEALMKAPNGAQLLRAQRLLVATVQHLALFPIVPFDQAAADQFDRLLDSKGLGRIGRGDLLNAAIALAHGAALVTRNLKDYRKVPGLRLENWAD